MAKHKPPLICLVTSYYDTNYIRTTTLREALSRSKYDFVHVTNTSRGVKRYIETLIDLAKVRVTRRPDIYFLTFRGYEVLPLVRLITTGKPLIFDEFINPIELVVHERKLVKNKFLELMMKAGYRSILRSVQAVTTDTESHAKYSADLMSLPIDKYAVLPVSTDEKTFSTHEHTALSKRDSKFQVFYYGSMLPLHGVDTVIEAMTMLRDKNDIELVMVGGKDEARRKIKSARKSGARISHKDWLDYKELPLAMQNADLCLGGPFGDTVQSQFVITGKTYQQLSMARPTLIGKNEESNVFSHGKDAIIVERGNPHRLAEAILWSYENRDKLAGIGRNGRKLYEDRFSLEALSKKLNGLFSSILEDR